MATPNLVLLANEVLRGSTKLPIDPFALVEREEIELAPGDYNGEFDGRLEYVPSDGVFILYYQEGIGDIKRLRFTIAHELGHFHIPEHQEAILGLKFHCSKTETYTSNRRYEQEADEFAAHLLMPQKVFGPAMRDISLKELDRLSDLFQTSWISTARRMVTLTDVPCSVVFCRAGKVSYALHSETMRKMGLYGINKNDAVPAQSQTAHFQRTGDADRDRRTIEAAHWYKSDQAEKGDYRLWEEVRNLGRYGTLTFLVYEE